MNKVFYALTILMMFYACKNEPSGQGNTAETSTTIEQSNIFLNCVAVEGLADEDPPTHEVFLQISESKVKVADILSCETLNPDQYKQYQIPATAISAVGGWWAGAGDYLYVAKEGDGLVVMQGEMYEENEDNNYNYRPIAHFNNKGERQETN